MAQIDFRLEEVADFDLHTGEPEHANPDVRLELHQQVQVAVRPVRAVQHRPEHAELADAVLPAELSERFAVDIEGAVHGGILAPGP